MKFLPTVIVLLLFIGGLVLPGAIALDSGIHEPFLSYTLDSYSETSVAVYFQIENIEDASVITNIYSLWIFGDGLNQTLDGSKNKSVEEVDSVAHVYQYGFYDVNVTLHINRYSEYAIQIDFNLPLNLNSEAGRDVKRDAFVTGLQQGVVNGLWLLAPLFFFLGLVSRFYGNRNARNVFRAMWITTTSIMLSFFVAPWAWAMIFDVLPKV